MDAVESFNAVPAARLEEDLLACCAAPAWGAEITAGRPFHDRDEVLAAADAASRRLSWDEVLTGLSAHPRIGERAAGDSKEAAWSRQEQLTTAGALPRAGVALPVPRARGRCTVDSL